MKTRQGAAENDDIHLRQSGWPKRPLPETHPRQFITVCKGQIMCGKQRNLFIPDRVLPFSR